jgi:hypothetical protein
MRAKLFLSALAAAVIAAFGMFNLKYSVVELEDHHRQTLRKIEAEKALIRTRKADLALLTRPQRLARHAEALGLKPAQGSRIVLADQIGQRVAVDLASELYEITLPSGGVGSLAMKPVTTFELKPLADDGR